MKSYKNIIFIFVTVFAILIQLANPALAYADDGTPPPPPESETEVAPPEVPVGTEPPAQPEESAAEAVLAEVPVVTELATEAASAEFSVSIEVPAADVVPVDDSNASTEVAATEEPTVLEIIEQLPGQTDIVVLDEMGEVVPLATQEAAEIIASGDPMWCPNGSTPVDNVDRCTNSYASLGELLTNGGAYINLQTDDGIIWITSSSVYGPISDGSAVTIDGLIYTNWATHALVLQGGYYLEDCAAGCTLAFSGNSVFSVPISITNWTGAVTVNNITVTNPAGTGLSVTTERKIELNNITVTGSTTGYGAYLDNRSSTNNAAVTLNGTNVFNQNEISGLNIQSDGAITLSNITASNSHTGHGAELYNTSSSSNAAITINGNNTFNDNDLTGLVVYSNGNISLRDVEAKNNNRDGIYVGAVGASTKIDILTNHLDGNGWNGFEIEPAVAVLNVTNSSFDGNTRAGFLVQSGGTINITGSTFSNNVRYSGLDIKSANIVSIENSQFNNNHTWDGASLNVLSGGLSVIDSTFTGNSTNGLYVVSTGIVTLENVTANGNTLYGIYIDNPSGTGVTISDITARNNCSGLYLNSPKDTTINGGSITENTIGIEKVNNAGSLHLNGVDVSGNQIDITGVGADCVTGKEGAAAGNVFGTSTTTITALQGQAEFLLDCLHQQLYAVNLPNGDRVQIVCPVSGKARISRMDNTTLPADLPAGYTYSSAFSLEIFQGEESISFISEGGYINTSFLVPSLEAGDTYSVLYWDNGRWVPLKDFMIDENGKARKFSLHMDDPRVILSGLNFVTTGDSPRAEISTNFPGIFVLAQH